MSYKQPLNNPRHIVVARSAIVGLGVLIAVQTATQFTQREPYPAMFQPSFSGDALPIEHRDSLQAHVTVETNTGESFNFSPHMLLADATIEPARVFDAGTRSNNAHTIDPRSTEFILSRVASLTPGVPNAVTIVWTERHFNHSGEKIDEVEVRRVALPVDEAKP